jgi:lactoylglutathione lyase
MGCIGATDQFYKKRRFDLIMPITNYDHTGVMVADLDRSIAFYQDILGLTLIGRLTHTDPSIELAFLGLDGRVFVELVSGYNSELPEEGKVHHLAFTVEGIEEEMARLKALNVTFIDEEITTLPNGGKYIYFYGPDREWIELFQH